MFILGLSGWASASGFPVGLGSGLNLVKKLDFGPGSGFKFAPWAWPEKCLGLTGGTCDSTPDSATANDEDVATLSGVNEDAIPHPQMTGEWGLA